MVNSIYDKERLRGVSFELEARKVSIYDIGGESAAARITTLASSKLRMLHSVKLFGVLQPPLVEEDGDNYHLIAGRHRFDQAVEAGELELDVSVIKWLGDAVADEELRSDIRKALRDETNFAQTAWTDLENARYLFRVKFAGWTPEEVAEFNGMPRMDVLRLYRLYRMPDKAMDRVQGFNAEQGDMGFDKFAIDLLAQEFSRKSRPLTEEQLMRIIDLCIDAPGPITEQVVKAKRDVVKNLEKRGPKPKVEAAPGDDDKATDGPQPSGSRAEPDLYDQTLDGEARPDSNGPETGRQDETGAHEPSVGQAMVLESSAASTASGANPSAAAKRNADVNGDVLVGARSYLAILTSTGNMEQAARLELAGLNADIARETARLLIGGVESR